MKHQLRWLVAALLSVGLVATAAACGDDDTDAADADISAATATPAASASNMGAEAVLHHWQALAALDEGDAAEAAHHVNHILTAVEGDRTHADGMKAVLTDIDGGDFEEASHAIEEMLADRADPSLTLQQLHVQMALDAIQGDEPVVATHHVGHFVEHSMDDHATEAAEDVLAALQADNRNDAEAGLVALMATLPGDAVAHGDSDADDAHDDDDSDADAHDDSDADAHDDSDADAHDDSDADAHDDEPMATDRDVEVLATEFAFEPLELHASVGEAVNLIFVNNGVALHDITADDFQGMAMASGDQAAHDSSAGDHEDRGFHAAAEAGVTVQLMFEANEPGEYVLYCSVPGHRQLGMEMQLIIE